MVLFQGELVVTFPEDCRLMTASTEDRRPPQTLAEGVARTVRHEVGDLLQTVYAAVAILRQRLPPGSELEHRLLADLRTRAEACQEFIDTVHDLFCPLILDLEEVDLAALAQTLVVESRAGYPGRDIRLDVQTSPILRADRERLAQIGRSLLANACGAARQTVIMRVAPGSGEHEVRWSVLDDGPGILQTDEGEERPFPTAARGHAGPQLLLAKRVAGLHGGRVEAGNRGESGFQVDLVLPVATAQPSWHPPSGE
jgi:signal transduction histidine kinase